ncbi:MAG: hypothetical protein R2825_15640 [Saprospiraceae bacterium]
MPANLLPSDKSNLPYPMRRRSVKYSGTLWREGMKMANQLEDVSSRIAEHPWFPCAVRLSGAEGVSEVASIGGFVKEYRGR